MNKEPDSAMGSRLVFALASLGGLLLASYSMTAEAHGTRAWLGVVAVEVSFERLAALGLEYGVEVRRVVPQGPAATAGLRTGDMIVTIAGRPVYSVDRLRWLVNTLSPGQEVAVGYLRAGERRTVKVTLRASPPRSERFCPRGYRPGAVRSYLGVRLQTMTDDLRQAFGVPPAIGVLVTEVTDNSPAADVGLTAGDVIIRMDRKEIAEIADVYRALDFFEPEDEIAIAIIRDKASKTLAVALGAPPPDRHLPRRRFEPRESPPHLPAPLLDPRYWQRQFDELMERWQEYWREETQAPSEERPL